MAVPVRLGRAAVVSVVTGLVAAALLVPPPAPAGASPATPAQGPPAAPCVAPDLDHILGWWRGEDDLLAEAGPELVGSTAFEAAVVERGFLLDGTRTLGTDALGAVSTGVTVEAWVRPVATGRTQALLSRWQEIGSSDTARSYALLLDPLGDLLWRTDETTTRRPVELRAPGGLLDDGYHHVAATWSPSSITLHVDGAPVASASSPGGRLNAAPTTPFRVGSSSGLGDPFFATGGIDEATVYDRALSTAEVAAIHAAGPSGKCASSWVEQQQLAAGDAAEFDHFGRAVAVDGDTVLVGAFGTSASGDGSGSAYVFVRSAGTWTQQGELTVPGAAAGDRAGWSVALDGDTAVVGAPGDDEVALDGGAAHVFTRTASTWTFRTTLHASDAATADELGSAVALDGTTLVVGAHQGDGATADRGSAYVFSGGGATWAQQAELLATDGASGDGFGTSVDVQADTVVVGAPYEGDGGAYAGAAYAYRRSGSTWTQQAKLVAADPGVFDQFGWSVAVHGDTAVVGANTDTTPVSFAGSAYVFGRVGAAWSQGAELTASDAAAEDRFGWSVATDGDTVVVGAPFDDDGGPAAGSAYVFSRAGASWVQRTKLLALDPSSGAGFGWATSVDGGTIAVGSDFRTTPAGDEAGAVHVFVR